MRAPAFWSQERPGFFATALYPFALIYDFAVRSRFKLSHASYADIDIICVGNFVTGGAGKTPTAIALAELLKAQGQNPVFLSRGYGGTDSGPTLIDPMNADAERFGDEPLLLARIAPTIIAKTRSDGAEMAVEVGADIVIMDDGLQNPTLHKSISIAVVDSSTGIGNGAVFPAGPLRASLEFQFKLVDAIVVIGNDTRANYVTNAAISRHIPVLRASVAPRINTIDVKDQKIVAYAGIGFPDKFFKTLEVAGAELIARLPFPDHHRFTKHDASRLLSIAKETGGKLVTTEKDLVRLDREVHLAELKKASQSYNITLNFEEPDTISKLIQEKIGSQASRFSA